MVRKLFLMITALAVASPVWAATQIQFRRDTAANWTSVNPILAQGEPGHESDTNNFKIGDGVTAWSSLEYFSAGEGGGATTSIDGGGADETYLVSQSIDGGDENGS